MNITTRVSSKVEGEKEKGDSTHLLLDKFFPCTQKAREMGCAEEEEDKAVKLNPHFHPQSHTFYLVHTTCATIPCRCCES